MELANQLLREGKITLDESLALVGIALCEKFNEEQGLSSTRHNLISELEEAIAFIKQHPQEKSLLGEKESLLAKLKSWQGKAANV